MKKLILKKLGNNWYLDLPHNDARAIKIIGKLNRYLTTKDIYNEGVLTAFVLEEGSIIDNQRVILFREKDLLRYATSSDVFNLTASVGGHKIKFNSELLTNINYHLGIDILKNLYKVMIN